MQGPEILLNSFADSFLDFGDTKEKGSVILTSALQVWMCKDCAIILTSALQVWVCKDCAVRFNSIAKSVFDFSDKREEANVQKRTQRSIRMLRDLQLNANPYLAHSYPVGEIPSMCTPRMYEALHSHTSRAYGSGPPQLGPEYQRNLLVPADYVQKGDMPARRSV